MSRALVLDLRSLSLMRILTGCLLASMIMARAANLEDYYTDIGFISRSLITEKYWNPVWWCVHLFSGSTAGTACLFVAHGVFALALALGIRTRLSSVICYLLTLSLANRNPLILDGGDRLFLLLLFWGMFLPWGQYYSWDAYKSKTWKGDENLVTCAGGSGYILQIVSMYLMAGLWKIHPVWLTELTALERALSLLQFTRPFGVWLLGYPTLLSFLTIMTFVLEWLGPLALLTGNGRVRAAAALVFAAFHLSIGLVFDLGYFPAVSLVCLVGFVPSEFWNRLLKANCPNIFFQDRQPRAMNFCAYAAILLSLWWNLHLAFNETVPPDPQGPLSIPTQIASVFRLAQTWNLFAPVPRSLDSRYFVEAQLSDGTRIDLLREGAKFSTEDVPYRSKEFEDQRQRMFLTALELSVPQEFRAAYLERLGRVWNDRNPGRPVVWLRLLVVHIPTYPKGRAQSHLIISELARMVLEESIWAGPLSSQL